MKRFFILFVMLTLQRSVWAVCCTPPTSGLSVTNATQGMQLVMKLDTGVTLTGGVPDGTYSVAYLRYGSGSPSSNCYGSCTSVFTFNVIVSGGVGSTSGTILSDTGSSAAVTSECPFFDSAGGEYIVLDHIATCPSGVTCGSGGVHLTGTTAWEALRKDGSASGTVTITMRVSLDGGIPPTGALVNAPYTLCTGCGIDTTWYLYINSVLKLTVGPHHGAPDAIGCDTGTFHGTTNYTSNPTYEWKQSWCSSSSTTCSLVSGTASYNSTDGYFDIPSLSTTVYCPTIPTSTPTDCSVDWNNPSSYDNGADLHTVTSSSSDVVTGVSQHAWLTCLAIGISLFIAFSTRFST